MRAVAFSPDGTKIAVASEYVVLSQKQIILLNLCFLRELHVKLIDVADPLQVSTLNGHKKGVRAATWDPSGTTLVCALIVNS